MEKVGKWRRPWLWVAVAGVAVAVAGGTSPVWAGIGAGMALVDDTQTCAEPTTGAPPVTEPTTVPTATDSPPTELDAMLTRGVSLSKADAPLGGAVALTTNTPTAAPTSASPTPGDPTPGDPTSGAPATEEPKEKTTTYNMNVPETIKPLKTITCGDVEVQWLKIDDLKLPDSYQIVTPMMIDADTCKVKLELLDKDGKVKETFETKNPMKPDDRLWIGRTTGYLYFELGRPGSYRITVTCPK
jgi:hypothetical protein